MSDSGPRTGAARDVPPPRPVDPRRLRPRDRPRPAPPGRWPTRSPALGRRGCDADRAARPGRAGRGRGARSAAAAACGTSSAPSPVPWARLRPAAGGRPGSDAVGRRQPWTPGRAARRPALRGRPAAAGPRRRPAARAHPGPSDDEIADALVARAARLTSGIGAATGGLSAAQWFAPPSLLALPLEIGAETVLVGGVEVVLIGELHELHGRAGAGDARERAAAYLAGWSTSGRWTAAPRPGLAARRRGHAGAPPPADPPPGPRHPRRRPVPGRRRARRAGNRRATEKLAAPVLADLRASRPLDPPGGARG